jgi:hypothetical protein
MESTINRGRAHECPYCFYKAELRKLKEHGFIRGGSDRSQYDEVWMQIILLMIEKLNSNVMVKTDL